jgi:hypothetical protein
MARKKQSFFKAFKTGGAPVWRPPVLFRPKAVV